MIDVRRCLAPDNVDIARFNVLLEVLAGRRQLDLDVLNRNIAIVKGELDSWRIGPSVLRAENESENELDEALGQLQSELDQVAACPVCYESEGLAILSYSSFINLLLILLFDTYLTVCSIELAQILFKMPIPFTSTMTTKVQFVH